MDAISAAVLPVLELGPADAAAGLILSDEAGWNQTLDDWRLFLANGSAIGCRDRDDRLVATAALLPYRPVAWVSMVLVTAAWRRRGLASALMTRCIKEATDQGVEAWLDATPAGAAVYERVGFTRAGGFQRLRRHGDEPRIRADSPTGVAPEALQMLLDGDRRAMGFDRSSLLTAFVERPNATVHARDGAVCLVRDGRRARHIGPFIAADDTCAAALLEDVLEREDGALIIDLVETRAAVLAMLLTCGFVRERPFRRMGYAGAPPRGEIDRLVASVGPEFG